jgi:tetrahydrodipicolinate N-succinyltransferase
LPYATTGTSDEDSILIGANCFFGYGSMVLGNVSIGHGSIVGAKSVVRHDIPPFSLAAGNPAKVLKYFDFSIKKWVTGTRPTEKIFEIPSEEEYIQQLSCRRKFPLQPISAASAWLSDI